MKIGVRLVLLILCSVLLIFSVWKIIDIQRSYQLSQDAYTSLEQYIAFPESTAPVSVHVFTPAKKDSAEYVIEKKEEEKAHVNWPQVDFEQLSQINPDIVGWIYIEGTNINYPIVQANDNDYYLTRLFDGSYNSSGSIFLDASASPDFSDRHSIIFGHNMKNNTMFASLTEYQDPAFFQEHPEILLLTPSCNYVVRIFSGHTVNAGVNAWERDFDDISFEQWLSAVVEQSEFSAEHQPQSDDLIVSLSTCSYEYHDARFLIHGYIAHKESSAD